MKSPGGGFQSYRKVNVNSDGTLSSEELYLASALKPLGFFFFLAFSFKTQKRKPSFFTHVNPVQRGLLGWTWWRRDRMKVGEDRRMREFGNLMIPVLFNVYNLLAICEPRVS